MLSVGSTIDWAREICITSFFSQGSSPAAEYIAGAYNPQNIYNMRPTKENYDIADWAIAGNRLPIVGDALWFYNPYDKPCRSYFPSQVGQFVEKIGQHCFYAPTDAYYET